MQAKSNIMLIWKLSSSHAMQLRSQRPLHVQGDAGQSVNKVVEPKRIIGKMEDQGGGEAQGVADPKKTK
jgi:hypothetical protein